MLQVGDKIRIIRSGCYSTDTNAGDEFIVTKIQRDHYGIADDRHFAIGKELTDFRWSMLYNKEGEHWEKVIDKMHPAIAILDGAGDFDTKLRKIIRDKLIPEKTVRLFAVWCARQVEHLMKDARSINALNIAEAYANGLATKEELRLAYHAAAAAYADAAAAYAADAAAAYAADAAAAYAAAAAAAADAYADAAYAADAAAAYAAAAAAAADAAARNKARENQAIQLRAMILCIDTKASIKPREFSKIVKGFLSTAKIKLSKRQAYAVCGMADKEAICYLNSKMGMAVESKSWMRTHLKRVRRGDASPTWYDNRILEMYKTKQRELYDPRKEKVPPKGSKSLYYGIELECLFPKENFDTYNDDYECHCECTCERTCSREECGNCGRCNRDCDGTCTENCECGSSERDDFVDQWCTILRNAKIKNVNVASDGSLTSDSDTFGVEFRLLVTIDDFSNLTQLLELVRKYNGFVDKSCGLHVHLDARHYKTDIEAIDSLGKKLEASLDLLVAMCPQSRRNNTYCRYGMSNRDRYYMINCTSLEKHKTIEVRLHAGSVDERKITNWVKILHTIRTNAITMATYRQVLPVELADYVFERVSKFEAKTETALPVLSDIRFYRDISSDGYYFDIGVNRYFLTNQGYNELMAGNMPLDHVVRINTELQSA